MKKYLVKYIVVKDKNPETFAQTMFCTHIIESWVDIYYIIRDLTTNGFEVDGTCILPAAILSVKELVK